MLLQAATGTREQRICDGLFKVRYAVSVSLRAVSKAAAGSKVGMKIAVAAIAVSVLATAGLAATPAPGLRASPDLAKGVEAFPRLVGDGKAIEEINAALTAADAAAAAEAKDCLDENSGKGHWTRRVDVTSLSARLVSFRANDDYYCGGAYPDTSATALVYDLETGGLVDWTRLIPGATLPPTDADTAGEALLPTIFSPKLQGLFNEAAAKRSEPDCTDVLGSGESMELLVWPDAKAKGLTVFLPGLPHAVRACGGPLIIPASKLKAMHADPALIEAMEAKPASGTSPRKL